QPVAQFRHECFDIAFVLKTEYRVIGIAYGYRITASILPAPLREPFVHNHVEEDVRHQWRDHRPLRRADLSRMAYSVLHPACTQPFSKETEHPFIGYPCSDHVH